MITKTKSQMEILGLAIIVIMIVIGLIFYIDYAYLKPKTDTRKSFTQKSVASGTLATLLKTTTKCKGVSVNDLLYDCASTTHSIECPKPFECETSSPPSDCTGVSVHQDSCKYAYALTNHVLSQTLDKWGYKYYLEAKTFAGKLVVGTGPPIKYFEVPSPAGSTGCPGEKIPDQYIIPLSGGMSLTLKLDICG